MAICCFLLNPIDRKRLLFEENISQRALFKETRARLLEWGQCVKYMCLWMHSRLWNLRAVGAEININNVYVRVFRESEALMQQQQFCELVFLLRQSHFPGERAQCVCECALFRELVLSRAERQPGGRRAAVLRVCPRPAWCVPHTAARRFSERRQEGSCGRKSGGLFVRQWASFAGWRGRADSVTLADIYA